MHYSVEGKTNLEFQKFFSSALLNGVTLFLNWVRFFSKTNGDVREKKCDIC